MVERVYVALDLETTGLEANRDAIIEIGAVCFQGDRILDRRLVLDADDWYEAGSDRDGAP